MPTIPFDPRPTVAPLGGDGAFQRIDARPEAFGAGVAQAGMGLAKSLDQGGNATEKIALDYQAEANKAAGNDAEIAATKTIDDTMYHPDTGFMAKKGKAAVDALPDAIAALDKARADAVATAPNRFVKDMLDPIVTRTVRGAIRTMNAHAMTEQRSWMLESNERLADTAIDSMSLTYNDDYKFGDTIGTLKSAAGTIAQLKGEDENGQRAIAQKLIDKAYTARYDAWVMNDPAGAMASFLANKEKISPTLALTLGNKIFMRTLPVAAAQYNAAGAPVLPSADSVPAADKDTPLPRGIRNNNPGNIVQSTVKWEGEVQGNDPRYVTFDTPEAGIRALSKNLVAYQEQHGINTVEGVIARWAPATENDTETYVKTVAKDLGVKPDQALNLADPKLLLGFTKAIIKHENGNVPYTDAQIAAGVAGKVPQAPRADEITSDKLLTVRTGVPLIDAMPPDWRIHVFQTARAQAQQDQAQGREALRYRVQDAIAMLSDGKAPPNAPSAGEIMRTFGQEHGARVVQEMNEAQQFGTDVQSVAKLPASEQAELLARRAPMPGEGYELAQKRHEQLGRAIAQVQQQRAQDPAAFALQNSPSVMAAYQAMATAKPDEHAAASQAYAAAALAEQTRLEVVDPKILPKNYVDEIARRFYAPASKDGEGTADTASIMRGVVNDWGRFWPVVGKQLAKSIPPGAVVIGLGVKPEAEQLISEALKLKPEQLKQGVKDPADFKDLQERVRSAFEPLQKTLAFQTGGQETYDNYADTADSLAIMLMHRGMKPKDAAAKAFESMAGFKYEFEDTWRVPKASLGANVTTTNIRAGAHMAQFDVAEKGDLAIPAVPGPARPEDQAKQWRQTVQDNGFWVTSPGDGGLSLWVKSGLGAQPVLDTKGQPIRRNWAELNGQGDSVRAARYSDVYKKGVREP